MGPLPEQADGKYESAIQSYSKILKDVQENSVEVGNETAAVISQLACEAYANVTDWTGMEDFISKTKVTAWVLNYSYFWAADWLHIEPYMESKILKANVTMYSNTI